MLNFWLLWDDSNLKVQKIKFVIDNTPLGILCEIIPKRMPENIIINKPNWVGPSRNKPLPEPQLT